LVPRAGVEPATLSLGRICSIQLSYRGRVHLLLYQLSCYTSGTMRKRVDNEQDFDGQREGEELLFVFRRHIIAMRKGFYGLLIPFAVLSIPPLIWQNNLELFLLPIAGLIIGLVIFSYHFMLWYYTVYIVTDQRLRQVTQQGFFGTDVVELQLSKIQNISYNIPGFSGEVFGYGTLVIQTFVGDLVIHKVEHPDKTYNKLQDAVLKAIDKQGINEKTEENTAQTPS
jgi:hypothetical protein